MWECHEQRQKSSNGWISNAFRYIWRSMTQTKVPANSGVAQWLACWAHNPKVRGSKPRSATCLNMILGCWGVPASWHGFAKLPSSGLSVARHSPACPPLLACILPSYVHLHPGMHSLRSLVAERQTCNLKVLGSIPSEGFTSDVFSIYHIARAAFIAQSTMKLSTWLPAKTMKRFKLRYLTGVMCCACSCGLMDKAPPS